MLKGRLRCGVESAVIIVKLELKILNRATCIRLHDPGLKLGY